MSDAKGGDALEEKTSYPSYKNLVSYRSLWRLIHQGGDKNDHCKIHISVKQTEKNMDQAYQVILPLLKTHKVCLFKILTKDHLGTDSSNARGKEFVIYIQRTPQSNDEHTPEFWLGKEGQEGLLQKIEQGLQNAKVIPGKHSQGDIRLSGSQYIYTRQPHHIFNLYKSADNLSVYGFTASEAATLVNDDFLEAEAKELSWDLIPTTITTTNSLRDAQLSLESSSEEKIILVDDDINDNSSEAISTPTTTIDSIPNAQPPSEVRSSVVTLRKGNFFQSQYELELQYSLIQLLFISDNPNLSTGKKVEPQFFSLGESLKIFTEPYRDADFKQFWRKIGTPVSKEFLKEALTEAAKISRDIYLAKYSPMLKDFIPGCILPAVYHVWLIPIVKKCLGLKKLRPLTDEQIKQLTEILKAKQDWHRGFFIDEAHYIHFIHAVVKCSFRVREDPRYSTMISSPTPLYKKKLTKEKKPISEKELDDYLNQYIPLPTHALSTSVVLVSAEILALGLTFYLTPIGSTITLYLMELLGLSTSLQWLAVAGFFAVAIILFLVTGYLTYCAFNKASFMQVATEKKHENIDEKSIPLNPILIQPNTTPSPRGIPHTPSKGNTSIEIEEEKTFQNR